MTTTTPLPSSSPAREDAPTWTLTVRNDGYVVDALSLEPVGNLAEWAVVEPAELGLLPGEEATVRVRYATPRDSTVLAGSYPVALRVVSREDPERRQVEEGVVDVPAFTDVSAELVPRTSTARGRGRGRHQVAVDNRGNTAAVVTLDLLDPDEQLHGTVEPSVLEVGPGRSELVAVTVTARTRFWRGSNRMLPFRLVVTPPEAELFSLPGNLLQRAVVPAWLVRGAVALLLLAVLLSGLWVAVLRPAVESSAREAASQEGAKALAVAEESAAAQKAAADAQKAALDALTEEVAAGQVPAPTPEPTPTPGVGGVPIDPLGDPLSQRLAVTAADQSPDVRLSSEEIVSVTDLLLQNPAGDTGQIRVTRDGTTLYTARLENFRDLDLHLVAPFEFAPGERLGIAVTCENPPELGACSPGVTVSGFARTPAPAPAPTPTP
jgi:hypothetical protein